MGGGRGVLTFLTSTSFTLRKMHTLRMLSYDHQGGGGGGLGGCINVPDEHFLYVTEDANVAHAVSCVKDYPHKRFKLAQVNHKQKISLLRLRLIIFEVVCGIIPIEPLLLVLSKWMEHGNT